MASGEEELPAALGWMVGLLEPGTRPGVFTFFKAVVIALVGCVAFMLFGLDMPSDVQFHLKIFLALSVALMILTIWCARAARACRQAAKRTRAPLAPSARRGGAARPYGCARARVLTPRVRARTRARARTVPLAAARAPGSLANCKSRWPRRRQPQRRRRRSERRAPTCGCP